MTAMTDTQRSDILARLLQAEQASVLTFVLGSMPYMSRADLRRPLTEMRQAVLRHEAELADAIEELGSTPRPRRVPMEHQYLAFLSMDYLLPKLIAAAAESIARYEEAISAIGDAHPATTKMLKRHTEQYRLFLGKIQGR